jgi:hypothetical protein
MKIKFFKIFVMADSIVNWAYVTCCSDICVADKGDDLEMWKVATYMLNKLSQTADKGWSSCI